jgi:hypothetical protein
MSQTNTPDTFDILLNLVVALIAPVFLGVTGGDLTLAQATVRDTINDYRARDHADLLAVAQIVGFGLAVVGSLGLSMAQDVPLSMRVRLSGNAVSCKRAEEQNRKARLTRQHQAPALHPQAEAVIPDDEPPAEQSKFLNPEAEQMLAAESRARLHPSDPINAGSTPPRAPQTDRNQPARVAKETTLRTLPPVQGGVAAMRAVLMSSAAHDVVDGQSVPPFLSRLLQPAKRPPT